MGLSSCQFKRLEVAMGAEMECFVAGVEYSLQTKAECYMASGWLHDVESEEETAFYKDYENMGIWKFSLKTCKLADRSVPLNFDEALANNFIQIDPDGPANDNYIKDTFRCAREFLTLAAMSDNGVTGSS